MRLLMPLALIALAACQTTGDTPEKVCTLEFRTIGVSLVDSVGAAVGEAAVDVIRKSTGQSIVCTREDEEGCVRPADAGVAQGPGSYEVMSDAVVVSEPSEQFRIVASHGDASAEALLTVGFDGCHVDKISGPDTLHLRR